MWLKRLFVQLTIAPEYRRLGSAAEGVAERIGLIYAVSHLLGGGAAVQFVRDNDPDWAPMAVRVVNTVNGHVEQAAPIIAGFLAGAGKPG